MADEESPEPVEEVGPGSHYHARIPQLVDVGRVMGDCFDGGLRVWFDRDNGVNVYQWELN